MNDDEVSSMSESTAIFRKLSVCTSITILFVICASRIVGQGLPIKMWDGRLGDGAPAGVHCESELHDGSQKLCFVANGSTLSAFRQETEGARLPVWQRTLPGNIGELGPPVRTSTGSGSAIFLGTTDGFLYRINSENGNIFWSRDLKRASCLLEDQIIAAPTVQLWSNSNPAFRAALTQNGLAGQDIVYAITRYGCGSTTMNRIYAVPADTGNVQKFWLFNEYGSELMDYASSSCALDNETNRLFCATEGVPHAQPSLWAIDTTNGLTAWTDDRGSIRSRPILSSGGDRIYVAYHDGTLNSYRKNDGQLLWTQTLTETANITHYPTELGAPFSGTIATTDNGGTFRAVRDLGDASEIAFPNPFHGVALTSSAAYTSRSGGKIYVGLNNGTVHQLDAATGLDEASVIVGIGPVSVLSIESSVGPNCQDRLLVPVRDGNGYKISALRIPWVEGFPSPFAVAEPCLDVQNSAPTLAPIGNRDVNEGKQLFFAIQGNDPDNDTLTYSATQLPPGATFDSVNQTLSYSPSFDVSSSQQNSFFDVLFTIADAYGGTASETVRITVVNVNRVPQADAGPDRTVNATSKSGADLMLDGSASNDPDNDSLTYTWRGDFPQGGGTVTGVQPTISLTPGAHDIVLTVDDGYGGVSDDTFHVQVNLRVEGLLNPMAALVPFGDSVILPAKAFRLRRTVAMKLRLFAGNTLLEANDVAPPQLVGIVRLGESIELQTVDPDTVDVIESSHLFRFADGIWVYELNTKELTEGTYAAIVVTPDGWRWYSGFVLR